MSAEDQILTSLHKLTVQDEIDLIVEQDNDSAIGDEIWTFEINVTVAYPTEGGFPNPHTAVARAITKALKPYRFIRVNDINFDRDIVPDRG